MARFDAAVDTEWSSVLNWPSTSEGLFYMSDLHVLLNISFDISQPIRDCIAVISHHSRLIFLVLQTK